MNYLLHILIVILTIMACADDAPACHPMGAFCPYKHCMRIRVHYINESGFSNNNQVMVQQDVHIKLGGIAGILKINADRHFALNFKDDEVKDCIFDTDELMRKTALQKMNISLNAKDFKTHNCTLELKPYQVKGSPQYNISLVAQKDGLHCSK